MEALSRVLTIEIEKKWYNSRYILKENPLHIFHPLENVGNQWREEPVFAISSQVTGSYSVPTTWEKEMATHSSILAWRIPGTVEPGGLPSMGSHRVGHDWSDLAAAAAVHGSSWNL